MRHPKLLITAISLALLLTSCGPGKAVKAFKEPVQKPIPAPVQQMPQPRDPNTVKTELSRLQANEAGKVMILMYHVIGAAKEADWVQTAENFRRDLQNFYEQGYSLISLQDLVENNIETPAGRTPLVLTFDDGTAGHFRYSMQNGPKSIDPNCAVGILLSFAKEHPDFGHTATFYVNDRPFGQQEYWEEKLPHLVELGFDLGNHTLSHPKLSKLKNEQVQKELAGLAQMVEQRVPGYQVTSLALPHGISPQEPALAAAGVFNGYSYKNLAILRVGANPALAPNVQGFDPARLPRVQASSAELSKWLQYFRQNPQEKYISDGDPETIAIPAAQENQLNKESLAGKTLLIWE